MYSRRVMQAHTRYPSHLQQICAVSAAEFQGYFDGLMIPGGNFSLTPPEPTGLIDITGDSDHGLSGLSSLITGELALRQSPRKVAVQGATGRFEIVRMERR